MWSQGLFINKRQDEGRFVQEGTPLQHQWKNDLPEMDNPHELNPVRICDERESGQYAYQTIPVATMVSLHKEPYQTTDAFTS